jgi:hypothetical protein
MLHPLSEAEGTQSADFSGVGGGSLAGAHAGETITSVAASAILKRYRMGCATTVEAVVRIVCKGSAGSQSGLYAAFSTLIMGVVA